MRTIWLIALLLIPGQAFANGRQLAQRLHALAAQAESANLTPSQATEAARLADALQDILARGGGGGGGGGGRQDHENCVTVRSLGLMTNDSADREQLAQLEGVVCSNPATPAGNIFYPNGSYAFVGGSFSDRGSWKYPNGKYAFVSGNYSDAGSWKYPSGGYAFVSGNYSDAGSWKYPGGAYAFVSGNYSDAGSYKYPNGKYAYVSGNYSDAGSWKYPNGKYAFVSGNYSDRNRWYYPTGTPYKDDPAFLIEDLVDMVELHTGQRFYYDRRLMRSLPEKVKRILTIQWIHGALGE